MASSRLLPSSDPLALAGLRATNTADCLRLVATAHERLSGELARTLSPRALEAEVAQVILTIARTRADQLVQAGELAPDGSDLFSRLLRGMLARRAAAQNAEAERRLLELARTP